MKALKLGLGVVSALLLLGAGTGSVMAEGTEVIDQDSFTFSGFASAGGGGFDFTSQSCSGTSISTVGEVSEVLVDIEILTSCQVQAHGQCFFGPTGPVWTGVLTIIEGQGSDNYSGPITVTWSGGTGTVSGTLTESEPNSPPENEPPAPVTGSLSFPSGTGDACNGSGPITGSLSTTA
jgi:hypothetical protein